MLVRFPNTIKDVPTTLEVGLSGRVSVVPKAYPGWMFYENLSGWIAIADPNADDEVYPWDGEYRGPENV